MSRSSSPARNRPVFPLETRDPLELASVGRDHRGAASARLAGDEDIVGADGLSGAFQCVVADSIVAVRGGWLSYYEDGDLIRSVRLPSDNLRLAGSGETNVVYVYGNSAAGGDVYAVFAGGTYGKLMHLDQPIRSVAAAGQRLFVSAGAKVLTWKEGEEPAAIVNIGDVPITSLAFDAVNRILYFTSGEGVFAQKDRAVFLALAGVSGELLFEDDTLFVSDAGQGAVVAVKGLAAALRSH